MTQWFKPRAFSDQRLIESRIKPVYPLTLSMTQQRELRNIAAGGYPKEVCGVIHTHGIIHVLPNIFNGDQTLAWDMEYNIEDPSVRYIWHSHPRGLLVPSVDDVPCMEQVADMGYHFKWLIVTLKEVREYEVAA